VVVLKQVVTTQSQEEQLIFEGVGWTVRLRQKRTNHFISIAKEIVLGNLLKKGDDLFYYLVDCQGQKALLLFLDGKERPKGTHVQISKSTFSSKK